MKGEEISYFIKGEEWKNIKQNKRGEEIRRKERALQPGVWNRVEPPTTLE